MITDEGSKNKRLDLSLKYPTKEQKRKNARIPVEIKGSFLYQDIKNKISDKCLINSLSSGGLSFISGMVLFKGDVVVVNFTLGGEIVSEYCKITRIHGKEVGSKFVNVSKKTKDTIQKHIYDKIFS